MTELPLETSAKIQWETPEQSSNEKMTNKPHSPLSLNTSNESILKNSKENIRNLKKQFTKKKTMR